MKSQATFFASSRNTTLPTYQPSANRIKVSLHQIVDDLLIGLDPLARKNNNVVTNGIPRGLCFVAEENVLAYVLWNLFSSVLTEKKNECIHIQILVDDHRTMICVNDAGTYLYRSLAPEYRRLQDAATQIGGSINLYNDEKYGNNLALSLSNTRMAV
jgi:hypothetical protein